MMTAIAIAPHLLDPFDALIVDRVRHGNPHTGVILMVGKSLHFHILSVKEKTGRPGLNRPYSKAGGITINLATIRSDDGYNRVQIGIFQRP